MKLLNTELQNDLRAFLKQLLEDPNLAVNHRIDTNFWLEELRPKRTRRRKLKPVIELIGDDKNVGRAG